MSDLPQVNESVRVWYGSGFIRSGHVVSVDAQDREVLVEFNYEIPDAWVREDQLC